MANVALFHTPTKHQLIPKAVDSVGTFVFLKVDVNDINRGQIVEISAIAVHIKELYCQYKSKAKNLRIVDKLTLCFDPFMAFNGHLSNLMKVDTAMIKSACKQKFDKKAAQLLHLFLQRQVGKICFVCHNGFRWDFQVLQAALGRLGQNIDKINGQDVLCADTLWTFKVADDFRQNSSFSWNNVNVSISDMNFYTLNSIYSRYLKKQLPEQLSAEEKNTGVVQLVYHELLTFLLRLCAKNFSLVKRLHGVTESAESADIVATGASASGISTSNTSVNESNSNDTTDVFVFVDIETTGLDSPKITEICLIAVHKTSIRTTARGAMPRIQDKLLLVIEPGCAIEEKAAQISGITNALIENSEKPQFNFHTAWAISQFLQQQSGTICLVAHNGNSFDYPHIKRHLLPHVSSLPVFSSVFSADSLLAMRYQSQSSVPCQKRRSHKLGDVYKRYFPDSNITFHNAESDTSALIHICCMEPDLLDHLDQSKNRFM